ncbi:gluconate 2-dehydrogenase subunit 3 family protein [Salinicoccus bachuensis]|uniref:Gluconate 2-dehydrogenase subunit 3 family protein n=1 Tax=Salinicoccus bachuensis TaxID=3136731 RepID=A0ABZ3CLI1_9STAP
MAEKGPDEKQFSRRDFLKTTGVATGGIIGGSLLGGFVGFNMNGDSGGDTAQNDQESGGDIAQGQQDPGRVFFHNDAEFETISQAMERIFPEDDMGPGAITLGAPYFLDMQLAGQYGNNTREYMQGPFYAGETTQGYQARLRRAELFRLGIERLNAEANEQFDDDFSNLDGEDQDEILTRFQEGEADLGVPEDTAKPEDFFGLLRSATIEGVYADPLYRGNRGMEGWKMKNFPGHQYQYIDRIQSDSMVEIDPQPLFGGDHNGNGNG